MVSGKPEIHRGSLQYMNHLALSEPNQSAEVLNIHFLKFCLRIDMLHVVHRPRQAHTAPPQPLFACLPPSVQSPLPCVAFLPRCRQTWNLRAHSLISLT